jgi:hypothetical protein
MRNTATMKAVRMVLRAQLPCEATPLNDLRSLFLRTFAKSFSSGRASAGLLE